MCGDETWRKGETVTVECGGEVVEGEGVVVRVVDYKNQGRRGQRR